MIQKNMSWNKKWCSEEVDEFYRTYIKEDVEEGYFPSYKYLHAKWYLGFYIALYFGKTEKYPNIEAFCVLNNLVRLNKKKLKWTDEYIEEFYEKNLIPLIKDNRLPTTGRFKEKGWEYWGFLTKLSLGKIEWYSSVMDFKKKKGLETTKTIKIYSKDEIDIFYQEYIIKHIKNNKLPNQRWFQKEDWKYLSWYRAIIRWDSSYKGLNDFSTKNWLVYPSKIKWTKDAIDEMFIDNIKPLMVSNKFLTYDKFKELWGKYINFYNSLRNKRVKGYDWIKDFKKQNKLK